MRVRAARPVLLQGARLLPDGVFFTDDDGETLRFRPTPPPTEDEVGVVLATIYTRVQRLLQRRGLDAGDGDLSRPDPVVEASPVLAGISSADRARLEQLCRYLLRPPVAQDRLRLLGTAASCSR